MKLHKLQCYQGGYQGGLNIFSKQINKLSNLQPKITIDRNLLNQIELILYSTNLCLFSMRILRDEIVIKNRNKTLQIVNNEISKLYALLSQEDFAFNHSYTKKSTKEFFKKIGLKPKHLKH